MALRLEVISIVASSEEWSSVEIKLDASFPLTSPVIVPFQDEGNPSPVQYICASGSIV